MTQVKIVSGGQTGVDQAALAAAKAAGLQTGGWMPRGWITLDGIHEDFRDLYGMTECPEPGYPARTALNVRDSDATVRIAKTYGSPGERCTLSAIHAHSKPHLDISWKPKQPLPRPGLLLEWLLEFNVHTLNVAGNSEQTAAGIYTAAYNFLLSVFILWKGNEHER